MNDPAEDAFRRQLAEAGLTLDAKAFAAALAGARHLRSEAAILAAYLARSHDD